ncbi:hypothetical protein [Vibrio sp. WXL103]
MLKSSSLAIACIAAIYSFDLFAASELHCCISSNLEVTELRFITLE